MNGGSVKEYCIMRLKTGITTILIALFITTFAYGETFNCPDGRSFDTKLAYKYGLPGDFPNELLSILCFLPCDSYGYYAMLKFPSLMVGIASASGNCTEVVIITWFRNVYSGRYIAFTLFDGNRHDLLWVSKTAPDGFGEYIQGVVDNVNREIGESF